MNRLASMIVGGWVALAASPVLAQQQGPTPSPAPGPFNYYRPGLMRGWGQSWGFHTGFIFHPVLSILLGLLLVALIVRLVRGPRRFFGNGYSYYYGRGGFGPSGYGQGGYGQGGPGRALDILKERFAKGEIDKAEYEEKRKLLEL